MEILRIIRVVLSVYVSMYDPFKQILWIDLSYFNDLERSAAIKAVEIITAIKSLLWEAIYCATPDIRNVYAEINAENFLHDGLYTGVFLKEESSCLECPTDYSRWSPKLETLIDSSCEKIKQDVKDFLIDMASTDGNGKRRGQCYEIYPRN